MLKVIIAGSRNFDNYNLLKEKIDFFLKNKINKNKPNFGIEIISGKARGADTLGERYAREKGFALKRFPADWNSYGKKAGYIRNKEMRDYADVCVVFWDRISKGSKLMKEEIDMKATGIVRRVDDLGRILIPKEIRKKFMIYEGTPLEIFFEEDAIVFKKYETEECTFDAITNLESYINEDTTLDSQCKVNLFQKIKEIKGIINEEKGEKSKDYFAFHKLMK